jgi:3'-phosphoadenosine 5'-phosphosulfate sulfotransferase (PAPS reductase)/FAD synthetase
VDAVGGGSAAWDGFWIVNAPIAVVSISGGKDSQATALCAIDAYGHDRVRLVMADTGHEHPLTMAFLPEMAARMNLPLTILRADFSRKIAGKRDFIAKNWEYMGVPLAHVDQALALLVPTGIPYLDLCMWKGRFPSRKAQFCTDELKGQPLDAFILNLMEQGHVCESWQGVRRDESQNRKDALAREEPVMDRPWAIVRPIVDWTADQTVAFVRDRGHPLNPLYSQGMKRVGCMPCINCGKDELNEIAKRWPEEIGRVREWEQIVADVAKRGGATFFVESILQVNARRRHSVSKGYAGIEEVVRWAGTSRGGKQLDFIRAIPADTCSSVYGLCE